MCRRKHMAVVLMRKRRFPLLSTLRRVRCCTRARDALTRGRMSLFGKKNRKGLRTLGDSFGCVPAATGHVFLSMHLI